MHWGGPASPGRTHLPLRTQETGLAMAEGFWSNHLLESKEGGLWSQGFLKLAECEHKAGKFSTNRGCGSVAERLLRVCKDLGSTPNSKKRTKVMILGRAQNGSRARGSAGLETRSPALAERASPSVSFYVHPFRIGNPIVGSLHLEISTKRKLSLFSAHSLPGRV